MGLPNVAKDVYIKYSRTLDSVTPILSPRYRQTPKLYFSTQASKIFVFIAAFYKYTNRKYKYTLILFTRHRKKIILA